MSDPRSAGRDHRDAIADQGYLEDMPLSLITDFSNNANPPARLTGATTPTIGYASNILKIAWAATVVNPLLIDTCLPRQAALGDLRTASPSSYCTDFRLRLLARLAGTTDVAATLGGALYATNPLSSAADGLVGPFNATFRRIDPTTYRQLGTTFAAGGAAVVPGLYELDFSTLALAGTPPLIVRPGNPIKILVTPSAHANDAIEILGAYLTYRRNPGLTEKGER